MHVVERPALHIGLRELLPRHRRFRVQHAGVQTGLRRGLGHLAGHGGGHRVVAGGSLGGVGHADHLAELDREVDGALRARSTLLFVGREQRRRRTAVEHQIELPRQVGGVADAGAHALAGEGRHEVRGVAGEQRPVVQPPVGHPRLERVDRVTLQSCVAGMHVPLLEQLPGTGLLSELLERLRGKSHELPAASSRSARDDRGRTCGVADLQVDRVELTNLVEHDVDDQPVVEEATVVGPDAEQSAHRRVRSVAADHVPGGDGGAVRAAHGDDVVVLHQRVDDHAAPDRDARQLVRPGLDRRLELGLAEHRRERPARRTRADAAEAQQRRARTVAPLVDLGRLRDRTDLVTDAARLEQSPDLVVEVHRTGQPVGLGEPFEHDDGPALLRQEHREGQSDGARADDRDVRVRCGGHAGAHGCRRGW